MYIHPLGITSWKDFLFSRGAVECWLAAALVLAGDTLGALAGQDTCQCGGAITVCCTFQEIFLFGLLYFILCFSIIHACLFYPKMYINVVEDYQGETTGKTIKGKVVHCQPLSNSNEAEFYVDILYKRQKKKYLLSKRGREHNVGEKLKLRILRKHPGSAWPVDSFDRRFLDAYSFRWRCPLLSLVVFGGIPAIIFFISYPWQTNAWALAFFLPAAAIISRRRCISVQNQVFSYARPYPGRNQMTDTLLTCSDQSNETDLGMSREVDVNAV